MTRTWIIINTHKLQKKVAGNLFTTNTFKKRPHAQNKSNLFLFVLVRKFLYANEKQWKKNYEPMWIMLNKDIAHRDLECAISWAREKN